MGGYSEALFHGQQVRGSMFLGYEGTIVGATYKKESGRVMVNIGERYADFDSVDVPSTQSQEGYLVEGSLLNMAVGQQAGPQGGERCIVIPTRGGLWVMLNNDVDDNGSDAPGTPAGDFWHLLPKSGTVGAGNIPVFQAGYKITQDGPTPGDGLGGTTVGNVGALTKSQTKSGHQVTLDDTAKAITVQTGDNNLSTVYNETPQTVTTTSAPGKTYTIWDGAGNAISHVVASGGLIGLGGVASEMDPTLAAINQHIVNDTGSTGLAGQINSFGLANLVAYITPLTSALSAGGLPNPSAFNSSMVAAIVASFIQKIGAVTGSQTVRIAN
jgi:hypothetical protein